MVRNKPKLILFANTDWYLYNFRLSLARHLDEEGWEVVLASPPGQYTKHFSQFRFRWVPIQFRRRSTRIDQEIITLLRIIWFYLKEKPDLVQHFTIKPVFYGSLAARLTGVPAVVNSVTGLGYFFLSKEAQVQRLRRFMLGLYRFALRHRRSRVIFENAFDMKVYTDLGLVDDEHARMVQGVGVDLDRFSPHPEKRGMPTVIMPARMLWDKGVREFVEAARLLKQEGLKARFALVGAPDPGNPTTIPEDQLYRWVQEGSVEWWGHRLDMPEIYRDSHLVALPSYSEGLATVLLEAAASGRPIVATDIPGCSEVVRDQITGFLVGVGDHEALARSIEVLVKDRKLRKKMGTQGREWVENRFSQQAVNQATIDIYNELLPTKRLQSRTSHEA
jgi:glycosyltransferase involved in cell wall biosynthesis